MSEGFSSIGERLYAALIESDRYMAYLRGFGQTLEVSLFAGMYRCDRRYTDCDYKSDSASKPGTAFFGVDLQYLYYDYQRYAGVCTAADFVVYGVYIQKFFADPCGIFGIRY